jgi:hypothetical protein
MGRNGKGGETRPFRFCRFDEEVDSRRSGKVDAAIRIEAPVAAVAIGAVAWAILFPGRFYHPAEYLEMIAPAVFPGQGFDHLFDGDEPRFIFCRIHSWPPFRAVPWNL